MTNSKNHSLSQCCGCCSSCNNKSNGNIDPKISRIKKLEEDLAKLQEALEPSVNTKAAYSGEFKFNHTYTDEDGNEQVQEMMVPWTTVKDILKAVSNRANTSLNPLQELREEVQEHLETILLEHSYEHDTHDGWWFHSCMSDQEQALKTLLEQGVFETHSERPALFRPIDKNHWFYANTREADQIRNKVNGKKS